MTSIEAMAWVDVPLLPLFLVLLFGTLILLALGQEFSLIWVYPPRPLLGGWPLTWHLPFKSYLFHDVLPSK